MAMTRFVPGHIGILTLFDLRAKILGVNVEFSTYYHGHSPKLSQTFFTEIVNENVYENTYENVLTQVAQKPCKNDFWIWNCQCFL